MDGFKELLSLQSIQGAIDIIQIHIQKLNIPFTSDKYSFKRNTHNM
jgi:hypothetical protein